MEGRDDQAGDIAMRRTLLGASVILGLVFAGGSVAAHHSANAKYDMTKPVTLVGKVTKMEWMNPHIYYYLDVTDASGTVTNWAVEGSTPIQLYRRGWRKDSLKLGDAVTVEGYAAREPGLHHINSRNVILPDGRKIFAGSNDGLSTR